MEPYVEHAEKNDSEVRYLMVPGIGGSGAGHWQSRWQADHLSRADRIAPLSWDEPRLDDWLDAIDRSMTTDTVIVAHSLGCLAVARWLQSERAKERLPLGAFLVAAPDRAAPTFPAAAATFTAVVAPLPVPAVVIGSVNDPYCTPAVAAELAAGWGARLVDVGPQGHLNEASGIQDWSEGRRLLTAFVAGCRRRAQRDES
ncbi:RBBP9/YdeN family alpha/beta hydrolase [Microbacterium ulmi]|uniref:Alpha/beta hydrolase n=2 Tax=Microbacterium ulmi TaxID=179095 RepID=A0A7Y2M037_9MICO|nr:alpha/beta hydrolase [Microbacterium ulmi]NNH04050.1 alpha/beta hydrolase [Microbacterium ulmi]